jgi:hypothetical protein
VTPARWLSSSERLFKLPATGGAAELFTEHASHRAQVVDDRVAFNVRHENGTALWTKSMKGGEEK